MIDASTETSPRTSVRGLSHVWMTCVIATGQVRNRQSVSAIRKNWGAIRMQKWNHRVTIVRDMRRAAYCARAIIRVSKPDSPSYAVATRIMKRRTLSSVDAYTLEWHYRVSVLKQQTAFY